VGSEPISNRRGQALGRDAATQAIALRAGMA
jgi:hypothetical protein